MIRLEELELSDNDVGDAGFAAFAVAIQRGNLRKLRSLYMQVHAACRMCTYASREGKPVHALLAAHGHAGTHSMCMRHAACNMRMRHAHVHHVLHHVITYDDVCTMMKAPGRSLAHSLAHSRPTFRPSFLPSSLPSVLPSFLADFLAYVLAHSLRRTTSPMKAPRRWRRRLRTTSGD